MSVGHRTEAQNLQSIQERAFGYFLEEFNPENGLVRDKNAPDWPASIAATGMALACYPVAVERGMMSASAAVERTLATLRFFWNSKQGPEADASGHHGFYYHFLDIKTGARAWQCELSTVDTAFLIAGMLTAYTYFADDTDEHREIRRLAEALYLRVDWPWLLSDSGTICHGWKPESGFLRFRWEGYDEALLLYVLALGSPSHPIPAASYQAWTSSYEWKRCYDLDYLYCGPLFTHQLSHVWIDFRGMPDAFMREHGIDYAQNSRRATLIQHRYAIDNPLGYKGYSSQAWGITASDGPGPATRRIDGIVRRFYDYEGRGAPYGLDDGTLSPWAVVASLPFAPEIVLPSIHHYVHTLQLHDCHKYGFRATFNPTFPGKSGSHCGWISPWHFGLNLGPIVLMTENHRSGMLWQLTSRCPWFVDGLRRAGFAGGWLDQIAPSASR
jgi:hypothetical protein